MINSRWLNSSLVFFLIVSAAAFFWSLQQSWDTALMCFRQALLSSSSFLSLDTSTSFSSLCAVSFYFVLFFPSNQTSDTSKDEHIVRLWPVVKSQYHSFLRPTHFCFLLLFCWSISHIVSLFSALIICIMRRSRPEVTLSRNKSWNCVVSSGISLSAEEGNVRRSLNVLCSLFDRLCFVFPYFFFWLLLLCHSGTAPAWRISWLLSAVWSHIYVQWNESLLEI